MRFALPRLFHEVAGIRNVVTDEDLGEFGDVAILEIEFGDLSFDHTAFVKRPSDVFGAFFLHAIKIVPKLIVMVGETTVWIDEVQYECVAFTTRESIPFVTVHKTTS